MSFRHSLRTSWGVAALATLAVACSGGGAPSLPAIPVIPSLPTPSATLAAPTASSSSMPSPSNSPSATATPSSNPTPSAAPVQTAAPAEAAYPNGVPWAIPGTISFDNYDTGGSGIGYQTNFATNQGGQYRQDGVSIGAANNAGGNGFFVGWSYPGNWYRYTVNVQTSATYSVAIAVASAYASSGIIGTFHIEDKSGANLTGEVQVPVTGSWDSAWTTVNTTMPLPAGRNILKVVIDSGTGSINLDHMTFGTGAPPTAAPTTAPTATPTPTKAPTAPPTQPPTIAPSPTPTAVPTASPKARAYSDWTSFGYDLARTSYNPNETTISNTNASGLHLLWSADMGDKIDASPLVLANVATSSGSHNMVLIGAENGKFSALDADSGSVLWSKQLGAFGPNGCMDLGGSPFGITGSAAVDRSAGRVYVADGTDTVFAFNLADGSSVAGWPVSLNADETQNHVYSGLALNPANGFLYASTAGYCDTPPWQGRISVINTSTATMTATFFPSSTAYGGPGGGGGIWGPVSAAIDPATNDVFVVTGNSWAGSSDHAGYGENIVRLNASLTAVVASNYPGVTGPDSDFGATPMIFTPPGCAAMAVAKNKAGVLVQWTRDGINNGPLAVITMAPSTSAGNFIGIPAYSPVTHDVYVGDDANSPDGTYAGGVDALAATGPNCTLQLKWKTPLSLGSGTDNIPVSPPATANGVVYFGSGLGQTLYALDANTGAQLWSSGGTIGGPIFAAPVIDGIVLVGSWDHKLYAFGL
jgi:outer membrane protein assembly factor BamB